MMPVASYLPLRRSQRRELCASICAVFIVLFALAFLALALFCGSWAAWTVFKALHA
jgi:hypothetical protein